MSLLLRTPSPRASESLLGYILRLSEANGYETPWHTLTLAGFSQNQMKSAGVNIDKLAVILGKDRDFLAPFAYQVNNAENRFQLLGHSLGGSLSRSQLRLHKPAICPLCIEKTGHIDAFWDLAIATACPTHGIKAVTSCPSCNAPLTWFRPGLLHCKCGSRLYADHMELATSEESDLMKVVEAKLHRREKPTDLHTGLPIEHLWPLSFDALVVLIIAIREHALTSTDETSISSSVNQLSTAARIFSNWPHNFHGLLRQLDAKYGCKSASLRKRFESFYASAFKNHRHKDAFRFLREEMIRFGSEVWGNGLVDSRMIRGNGNEMPRFMSRQMFSRHLGVHQNTVTSWADKGLIKIKKIDIAGHSRYVLDSREIASPTDIPGIIYHERDAASRIGIPVSVLKYIKRSGHYEGKHRLRFKGGFHELDIDTFIAQLRTLIKPAESSPTEPVVSLEYVMQEIRFWSKTGKGEFLAAFIDGEIRSFGSPSGTIGSTLFLRSDVHLFAEKCRNKASDDYMSLTAAADVLGCTFQTVRSLAFSGYLEVQPGPDRLRVSIASVDDFSKKYITSQSIARHNDSTTTRIRRIAKQLDIDMICIPDSAGVDIVLVRASDRSVLESHILTKRNRKRDSSCDALTHYCDTLKLQGTTLPRLAGNPNLYLIAKQCGFNRNAFYNNRRIVEILAEYNREERERLDILPALRPSESLAHYLGQLRVEGKDIPRTKTRPNLKMIAAEAGFSRDYFYSDENLSAMLTSWITESSPPSLDLFPLIETKTTQETSLN